MKKFSAFMAGFLLTWAALVVAGIFFFYVTSPDKYTVLVIGSDQRGDERARSDVMFLVSMPKSTDEKPYFLSIPRDTKVEDQEWGLQKMTHFYALGDRPDDGKVLGNVDLTRGAVEGLLGIKVDGTVEVTFQSFQELIDELGGVTLHGEKVNGEEALAVVRDRFSEGRSDFDRQADEREIFRSLLTKVKQPNQAKMLMQYFEDAEQARIEYKKVKLARFLIGAAIARKGDISIGEMEEGTIPGVSDKIYTPAFGKELYYWIPDEEETQKIVDEHFK